MSTASDNIVNDTVVNRVQIEERIKPVIWKIKASRSRLCYQNILTSVNRGGCEMDMDELKEILNAMIDSKMICNIGKEGNESFKIYEEENFQSMDEVFSQTSEIPEPTNNLEHYINTQFYETLITRIKTEVNKVLIK